MNIPKALYDAKVLEVAAALIVWNTAKAASDIGSGVKTT